MQNINSARGKRRFAEIEGTDTHDITVNGKTFHCTYRLAESDHFEPRPIARGNLARSVFYMCKEYGFPVEAEMLATLKAWNKSDPPTTFERKRAAKIAGLQRRRNPFVEKPDLADDLRCPGA